MVRRKQQDVLHVFRVSAATKYLRQMQLQVKMPEKSRNNVFLRQQTRKKVPPNIFRLFEARTKVQLMF